MPEPEVHQCSGCHCARTLTRDPDRVDWRSTREAKFLCPTQPS